jgi:hypothetical protein
MLLAALINENDVVEKVIVIPDDASEDPSAYINSIGLEGEWAFSSEIQNPESFSTGAYYDREGNFFVPPSPGDDFSWNEQALTWEKIEQ